MRINFQFYFRVNSGMGSQFYPPGFDIYVKTKVNRENVTLPVSRGVPGGPRWDFSSTMGGARPQHPRVTTEQNIANFRRQLQSLGFSYGPGSPSMKNDPILSISIWIRCCLICSILILIWSWFDGVWFLTEILNTDRNNVTIFPQCLFLIRCCLLFVDLFDLDFRFWFLILMGFNF